MNQSIRRISGNLFVIITILFTFFKGSRPTTLITTDVLFLSLAVVCFFVWFLFSRCKVKLFYEDILLLGFVLYVIVDGLFMTPYKVESFEYWSLLLAATTFKVVIQNDLASCRRYMKYSYDSALIITVSIVMQWIFPGFINSIQKLIFGDAMYRSVREYNSLGYVTGIAMQNSVAVWISTIFLSFLVAQMLTRRKLELRKIALLCLCLLAIVLTKKRAVLLAAAIASYFLYVVFNKNKSAAVLRMIAVTFCLCAAAVVAYQYIPQFRFMWDKTFESDRVLSGREAMWLNMIAMFHQAPIFGVGGGTCEFLYTYGGHNCYLQLLGEYGIVGFCLFLLAFVVPYVRSLVRTKKFLKDNRYTKEAGWLLAALFMQTVFFIYCISGNPVFDHIFFTMQLNYMAITQNVLSGKLSVERGIANERIIHNRSSLSGRSVY